MPDSDQSLDIVAKHPQVGQSLEVSCDQLGQGETLEEKFYLCTHEEGLRGLLVTVSVYTMKTYTLTFVYL